MKTRTHFIKSALLITLLLANFSVLLSQVAINTDGSAADSSAMLDVKSDTTGILIPRMTATQRDAISNPANGLVVYVTTDSSFYYYRNNGWSIISSDTAVWQTSGNDIYTISGNVGIGLSNPSSRLFVKDTACYYRTVSVTSTTHGNSSYGYRGINVSILGDGSSEQTGTYNYINNAGDGNQYGTYQVIYSNGNGTHYGSYCTLQSSGDGEQYGSYHVISNTGDGAHYGSRNFLTFNHWGNYGGNGDQYGTYQEIDNKGSGNHYGSYNYLTYYNLSYGNGDQYGTYQKIDNKGSGNHYGVYNNISGIGSGNKYGTYDTITTDNGGTHYGVYSVAEGAGNYAGYFKGRVHVNDKVGIGITDPSNKFHVRSDSAGLSYLIKLENHHDATTDDAAGILFSAGGSGTNERGKGALVYEVSDTWNRGDFHFLQDDTASASNPDLNDAVVTIKNNGNVGVGITNPSHKLYVRNNVSGLSYQLKIENNHDATTGDAAGILFSSGGSGINERGKGALIYEVTNSWNRGDFHFLQNNTTNTDNPDLDDTVMTIKNNGYVGIGLSTPSTKLDIDGEVTASGINIYSSSIATKIHRTTNSLGGISFYETGTTGAQWIFPFFRGWQSDNLIVRDDASSRDVMTFEYGTGYVGIEVSDPDYKLELPNNTNASGRGRANAWVTYSDGRLKTDQKNIDYGLTTIMQLRPKRYLQHTATFKDGNLNLLNNGENTTSTIGFVAQELYKVVPEAAFPPKDKNTGFWAVDYEKIIPILTRAIQEQQQEIETLKTKNNELTNKLQKIEVLEKRLKNLENNIKR